MNLINEAYLLRWRFDFRDRPSRMGMWSNAGPLANQAVYQNKEGLLKASIESKDVRTKETKLLVSCVGQDFRNFQTISAHKVKSGGTEYLGMCMWMRNQKVEIFKDGRCKVHDLSDHEKSKNLVTYGK